MEILSGPIRLLATMLANYKQTYAAKVKTADEAVAPIKDKEILVVAMSIGQPPALLKAIADRFRGQCCNFAGMV